MIRNFTELVGETRKRKGKIIGVPAADDLTSIETVLQVRKDGLADFILCGDREKISRILRDNGGTPGEFEIMDSADKEQAAARIVELARLGRIHVILKGGLPTATLMKPALDREKGLRTGKLLSDILVLENPGGNYDGLLGITDGGLNISPDLLQKKQIIENAVAVFHRLGYAEPLVGILAAIETVKDSMPATTDAYHLTSMNRNGEIAGCRVYGPLALDIAISRDAARHKGIINDIAGSAQILVVPNIESGNILGKAFVFYLKIPVAHVIMGARIPILIPSRSESFKDKFFSVALGVTIADS